MVHYTKPFGQKMTLIFLNYPFHFVIIAEIRKMLITSFINLHDLY